MPSPHLPLSTAPPTCREIRRRCQTEMNGLVFARLQAHPQDQGNTILACALHAFSRPEVRAAQAQVDAAEVHGDTEACLQAARAWFTVFRTAFHQATTVRSE